MIHGLNHPTLPIPKPTLVGMQDSIVALLKQGLAMPDSNAPFNSVKRSKTREHNPDRSIVSQRPSLGRL